MTRGPYGDPRVDALIPGVRRLFVANYLDGDDGGYVGQPAASLADDVAEIFAVWAVDDPPFDWYADDNLPLGEIVAHCREARKAVAAKLRAETKAPVPSRGPTLGEKLTMTFGALVLLPFETPKWLWWQANEFLRGLGIGVTEDQRSHK